MPKHIQTQTEWEQMMARRVMEQLRGELYLDQRYLTAALGALPAAQTESGGSFATDGGALYYPAPWVLDTYRKNRRYLPRAYLHSLFHCIFRHLWLRDKRDPDLWGLACDIAVESTLDALNTAATKRPVGWVRQQCYTQLRQSCKFLAAGPIYRVLTKSDAETLNKWQREFYTDSHRLWPADPTSPEAQMRGKQWENLGRQTELSMEENGQRAGQDTAAQALQAQVQAGRSRRTYRRFAQRAVAPEILTEAVDAARIASCGANRQTVRYCIVESPAAVAAVQPLVHWAAYLPREQGTPQPDEQPTAFIAILQDDRLPGANDVDIGLALGSLTAAAWAHGVGSCIMGAINKPVLTELLGIEAPQQLVYMVAFGYPSHKSHIVPLTAETGVKYYLDENRDYCVPKRSKEEIARYL